MQFLKQHIGRRRHQYTQLVRQEAAATGAVNLKPIFKFLDPILRVTTPTINLLVNMSRRSVDIRDQETGILLRLTARMIRDLTFDDHPSFM